MKKVILILMLALQVNKSFSQTFVYTSASLEYKAYDNKGEIIAEKELNIPAVINQNTKLSTFTIKSEASENPIIGYNGKFFGAEVLSGAKHYIYKYETKDSLTLIVSEVFPPKGSRYFIVLVISEENVFLSLKYPIKTAKFVKNL